MAHTLRLMHGSEACATLTSGSYKLLEYIPRAPDISTVDTNSILTSGGERPLFTYRNVTESARILISASTKAAITLGERKIQELFTIAAYRQSTKAGSPVFVEFTPDGGSTYRSEILSGRTSLNERSMDWHWNRRVIEADIVWTRRHYWEGDVAEISVFDGNNVTIGGSNLLDNGHDASRRNWIQLEDAVGDLPTPPWIRMTNATGGNLYPSEIHIGMNFYNYRSASFSQTLSTALEFENITSGTGITTTIVANSAYNNGSSACMTAPAATTQGSLGYFALGASALGMTGGRYFNALLRKIALSISGSQYLQLRVAERIAGQFVTLMEGPEVQWDESLRLQNIGTLRIPATFTSIDNAGATNVQVAYRGSSSNVFNLDTLYLMPADGYMVVKTLGLEWLAGSSVVIDPDQGNVVYHGTPTGASIKSRKAFGGVVGKPIMLMPSSSQQLFFLITEGSVMTLGQDFNVEITYRPRVLNI